MIIMGQDSSQSSSDNTLLRKIRLGDDDAAFALYKKYAQRLAGLANRQTSKEFSARFDPEDIVQSVFRTFFRRASAGEYEIPEGEELWKLLLVIALNKVRAHGNFHRARKRDVSRTQQLPEKRPIEAAGEASAEQILQLTIAEILDAMPSANQMIVRMRIDGYRLDDIAQAVQRSKRTVERTLQNFRKELFARIEGASRSQDAQSGDSDAYC